MRRLLKRIVTPPLLLVAAVVILVEETLWRLSALFALLGKLGPFRWIEDRVRNLGPFGALCVFGVPAIALAPIKLLAVYWLSGGHPALGVGTIMTAKVAGTALVARIYHLTRPALLTLAWFARCEAFVLGVRAAAYAMWRDSAAGRWMTMKMRAIRERLHAWRQRRRSWLAHRFEAVRRWLPRGS
ncbi:MAG: hypothetical protein U0Q16_03955 [Bryobacteraceae bacterium]